MVQGFGRCFVKANPNHLFLHRLVLGLIMWFGLTNTRVSDLSGGQRKRLSIAMEMVIDSDLLILDEPTSGLDSKTADTILELLKSIASRGRAVLCTIHAPSARSLCE